MRHREERLNNLFTSHVDNESHRQNDLIVGQVHRLHPSGDPEHGITQVDPDDGVKVATSTVGRRVAAVPTVERAVPRHQPYLEDGPWTTVTLHSTSEVTACSRTRSNPKLLSVFGE